VTIMSVLLPEVRNFCNSVLLCHDRVASHASIAPTALSIIASIGVCLCGTWWLATRALRYRAPL
jgi:hypothetical protein